MIQIKRETAFVAVENHGDPIWGGFCLYVVHKQKRDRWQISPLINQEDFHAIQQATLAPMYIVRKKQYELKLQWYYTKFPVDDTEIFQKFSTKDKVIRTIQNTL
jgi:hypothetical protein